MSQNVTSGAYSSLGTGRLSDLLRCLGFLSGTETSRTSSSDGSLDKKPKFTDTCTSSTICQLMTDQTVVPERSDLLSVLHTNDELRRCGAKQSHSTAHVGLNYVSSLKRCDGASASSRKAATSFAHQSFSAIPANSSGVLLRNQVINHPVSSVNTSPMTDLLNNCTFSEASIPSSVSPAVKKVFSTSDELCTVSSYHEGNSISS